MSTRSRPTELLVEALEDDENEDLLPLGEYCAREDDGYIKTSYPSFVQKQNDVDEDTTFQKFYHPPTGATITIPVDE